MPASPNNPSQPPRATADLNDIRAHDWVSARLPGPWQAYARLMRLDRPIGTWLTLLPALASLLLSAGRVPQATEVLVFSLGALLMRSAGCSINDIFDRRFDAQVNRTRERPLANGSLSLGQALTCLVVQLLLAAVLLLFLQPLTLLLALCCVPLTLLYPLLKRFTHWPQAFLGAVFNWGVLMASVETTGRLQPSALALWLGCLFWQLGYDTLYAYSDRADDLKMGLRSTATLFAARGKAWIGGFYAMTLLCWCTAGVLAGVNPGYFILLLPVALSLAYQLDQFHPDNPEPCNNLFRSNCHVGVLLLVGTSVSIV
ncbi:4-hydroxybenzoate octaprenyltransferase [Pseudomonas chlororaphis]|uniref:4-hydroxybenzoate octaprenyltransferase n=1 Tax=Pseudomonas chlororaphis TaxID=587753 RepID=UPI0003D39528|nr:4-hydroxybenzoate octaprenyltransferase [Pseudomonas chlororaphis]AZD26821.1 4-hydroxybenzoate polyprenyltransferase [Pseudomonas chlororaphis]ETD38094.1 4-hydroxybenzoate polyprenyltransferase [Pseudomonas chlororaphis subsp. aurantiaca PB-St2]QFS58083.1 4-hydroxybenzoate octaprenyltransferase [Pseudomonas chlororaphis subsp. aurantiaca]